MMCPNNYSPLNLAYLGDAVFELFIREKLLADGNAPVDQLNKKARAYVNAAAQAKMYFALLPLLTEDEIAVLKRGRNAKSFTKAKNATVADYRHATGLEALLGYLHVAGQRERLLQIMEICVTDGFIRPLA